MKRLRNNRNAQHHAVVGSQGWARAADWDSALPCLLLSSVIGEIMFDNMFKTRKFMTVDRLKTLRTLTQFERCWSIIDSHIDLHNYVHDLENHLSSQSTGQQEGTGTLQKWRCSECQMLYFSPKAAISCCQ